MAVNYANALVRQIDFSGLVSTREEGPLVEQLNDQVVYLHLDKKKEAWSDAVGRTVGWWSLFINKPQHTN